METKKFQRRKENFICEHCGAAVEGNGYTDHCPKCLWSKHVDVNPGDRAAACGGMMEPVRIETVKGRQTVVGHCRRCGFERRSSVRPGDDFDAVVAVAKRRDF